MIGQLKSSYSRTSLKRPPTGPGKSGRLRGVPALEELVVVLSHNFFLIDKMIPSET